MHVVVLSDHGPATGTSATSDDEGAFELTHAPSGSVVVKVIAPPRLRPRRLPVEVPSGGVVALGAVGLEAVDGGPRSD